MHDGFRFTFTLPLDPASIVSVADFHGHSYTYTYHSVYGSPEVDAQTLQLTSADVAPDRRSVVLKCANLRAGYVHEIELPPLRSQTGEPLWHRMAYYTLNLLP